MIFKSLQSITAILLFWAILDNPYDYYTLLRFVVCPVSAYAAYKAYGSKRYPWTWLLGIAAVLFNPIFKVHLQRETWTVLNIILGLLTFVSIFAIKPNPKDGHEEQKET